MNHKGWDGGGGDMKLSEPERLGWGWGMGGVKKLNEPERLGWGGGWGWW